MPILTDAKCRLWADILDPGQAKVLATYTGSPYAGKAAITAHSFGRGNATYIGCHVEPADLGRVLLTLSALSGVKSPFQATNKPESAKLAEQGRIW